eukprot:5431627-Alexandrium_andersonii.AAC.1
MRLRPHVRSWPTYPREQTCAALPSPTRAGQGQDPHSNLESPRRDAGAVSEVAAVVDQRLTYTDK